MHIVAQDYKYFLALTQIPDYYQDIIEPTIKTDKSSK